MNTADERIKAHREVLWDSLVAESGNAFLTPPVLFNFFVLQGLKLGSVKLMDEWFEVFGKVENKRKVICREEFDAVLAALGDAIREPMQKEPVLVFFQSKLNIGSNDQIWMGQKDLSKLLESVHMEWTKAQKRHLISFMLDDINAREISIDDFIENLMRIERTTLNVLNQAAQRMKNFAGPRPPLAVTESRDFPEPDVFAQTPAWSQDAPAS